MPVAERAATEGSSSSGHEPSPRQKRATEGDERDGRPIGSRIDHQAGVWPLYAGIGGSQRLVPK
eukprot:2668823-Prymnesium_polylepis.1